jgi:hypothetical protein
MRFAKVFAVRESGKRRENMNNLKSHHVVMRLITPLTVLAMTKLLESKRVKSALQEVDARTYMARRKASRAVERGARNARDNAAWLAAGTAAIALGIGLMAKAMRKG